MANEKGKKATCLCQEKREKQKREKKATCLCNVKRGSGRVQRDCGTPPRFTYFT